MELTLGQIARLVNGTVQGDENLVISDVAEIQHAQAGQITFLANPKYAKYVATTAAAAIIVAEDTSVVYPNLVRVKNPNYAFALLIAQFRPELPRPAPAIHPTAVIADDVILGRNVYIGPHVVIENGAMIGDEVVLYGNDYIGTAANIGPGTIIFPHVTIYHRCIVGARCRLHAGVVIGSEGFGFVRIEKGIEKIPQAGRVIIGDEVEIGANTTVDRGTLSDTVIGRGTKLDNLIQIGHNVKIGEYCFMAAQSGVAGSAVIEDGVTIGGQVGIAGHLRVGRGAMIAAQSGITKDVAPGAIMLGSPAQERTKFVADVAALHAIPDLKERLKKLEELMKSIKPEG